MFMSISKLVVSNYIYIVLEFEISGYPIV